MTVEDLLTMRLGFGWVFESECPAVGRATELELGFGPPDPPALPPPDEWIARFAKLPLLEQPGSVWRYELAFAVLGVLVARAAGRPLDVTLTDRLFTPLGMTDTASSPIQNASSRPSSAARTVSYPSMALPAVGGRPRPDFPTGGAAWCRPPATFCASRECCSTEAVGF